MKVKRKGAYEYVRQWHQDASALVVPRAAEAALIHGIPVEHYIMMHSNPFDFMSRAKAPRGSKLMHGDTQVANTVRYYVAHNGAPLVKVSPPPAGCTMGWYRRKNGVTQHDYDQWHIAWGNVWHAEIHTGNKSVYETRYLGIDVGWNVALCNTATRFDWVNVNRDYYIQAARKLVDPLVKV